jgi:hypothetical protein
MKRVVLVALGLLLVASASFAQPDSTYVGLFADVDHSIWSVSYAGTPTDFMLYLYWLPGVRGLIGLDFAVSFPAGALLLETYPNSEFTVSSGTLKTGVLAAWGVCQPAGTWVLSHSAECLLMNATPGVIHMIANPSSGLLQLANCLPGYQLEPAKRFTDLCLNQACPTQTESKSWGAIKNLF